MKRCVTLENELSLEKGVFAVSIDVELAWGFNYELLRGDIKAKKYLKIISDRSRKNIRKILYISELLKIPLTWGIVGHLFLSSCNRGENGLPHPEMPRPNISMNKDWYDNDPCSDIGRDPIWYGSDIVEQILSSKVEHEIACHSFSHIDFPSCSREVALAEVRKCKEVMKDYGIKPRCFIFPKNRVGHLDLLKEEGFETFRFKLINKSRKTIINTIKETISPAVGAPMSREGLIGIPASLTFQSPSPSTALRLYLAAKRGIDKAILNNRIFQITFHDYLETNFLLTMLFKLLKYADKLRSKDKLYIETLSNICQLIQ